MKPVLILKTGSTVKSIPPERGDFEQWIRDGLGVEPEDILVIDVMAGELPPSPDSVAGVVITGSPAMVTQRLDWSENTAAWLRLAIDDALPVLGICYGHQLLAYALGGNVDFHPDGREIGTVEIAITEQAASDRLFSTLPSTFAAQTTHSQIISVLPKDAVVLAGNEFDPYHAVRFRSQAWGVQFHPEFAPDVMLAYLRERREVLEQEGFDVAALEQAVRPTPEASSLLRRFAGLARSE